MSNLEDNIFRILVKNSIEYELFEHRAVYTCADMARALNVMDSLVLKSLVLKTEEGNTLLLVLPGDKKFDPNKIAKLVKTKKLYFAKPEEVEQLVGCKVGCVPPFGQLHPIRIYLSRDVLRKKRVFFNPGVHTKSVRIDTKCLIELCEPVLIQG